MGRQFSGRMLRSQRRDPRSIRGASTSFNGPIVQRQNISMALRRWRFNSARVHQFQWADSVTVARLLCKKADGFDSRRVHHHETMALWCRSQHSSLSRSGFRSVTGQGCHICLDSSIGRAADSRRLVSKENTSNGGGRVIRPAASLICGLWVQLPLEVPSFIFKWKRGRKARHRPFKTG